MPAGALGAEIAPRWKTSRAAGAHPAPLGGTGRSPPPAVLGIRAPSPGDTVRTPDTPRRVSTAPPTLLTLGEYLISPYSISYARICRPSVFLSEVVS